MAWWYIREIQEAPKVVISAWGLMKTTAHRKLVHDLQCVVKGLNMKLLFLGKWCDYKISWLTAWWFLPSKYWFLAHSLHYHLCLFFLTSFNFSFLLTFIFHSSVYSMHCIIHCIFFPLRGTPGTGFMCFVAFITMISNELLLTAIIGIILICFTLFFSRFAWVT